MIHYQGIDVEVPRELTLYDSLWVEKIISNYNRKTGEVFFLFCSDEYLYQMNVSFLEHDTYTDIITFDQSDHNNIIRAELYISLDRIKDNAQKMQVDWLNELRRVMAHGVLHLIGFTDKNPSEQIEMRRQEELCLSLLTEIH